MPTCQRCGETHSGPARGRRGELRCPRCEADFRRAIGGDVLGLLRSLAALGALVSVRVFIYPGLSLFVSPTLAASICVLPGSVVVSKHCFDEVARIDRTREVFLLERSVRRPRLPAARLITR